MKRIQIIKILLAIYFLIYIDELLPQAGKLDSTFGQNGIVTTAINVIGSGGINAITIQNDGKVLAAGYIIDSDGRSFFSVARFNSDGSTDNTFGIDGFVTTRIGESDVINSISVQDDGKIVAAGYSFNGVIRNFALARYSSNGELDLNFGSRGTVVTKAGEKNNAIYSLAIQEDGKIVAAGYKSNGTDNDDFCLARYNTDGSLDETFESDGIAVTRSETSMDRIYSVAIQQDGKIVVAGYTDLGGDKDFALARYNSNGTLDNTFGLYGILITAGRGSNEEAKSVSIQNDGKIVAAGYSDFGGTNDFALARYDRSGNLDNSFGTNGIVITVAPGDDKTYSAAIQDDGKIIAAGYTDFFGTEDFALVRYNSKGNLDTTFGEGGVVTTGIGSWDEAQSLAISNEGKIIAAGFTNNGGDADFALTCYNSDGNLDNTFGTYGIVTTNIGTSSSMIYSINIQSVGGEEKIVAAGSTYDGNDYDFALARYNADGTLDNTFGIDGIVTTKVSSNNNDEAISGVIQSDGKFIAAGHSNDEGDYKFALVRYTVNGFPEKTVTTQAGVSFSTAYSVEIQSDGKIIAAGSTYNGRNFAFALIRYNVDLSLDNSFGTDGIVTTEIGTIDDRLSSIVIQEDGKIVAAGSTCRGHNDYDIALVRYNLNGDLDTTFGEGGIVITQIDTAYDDAYSVAVQKNNGSLTGEKIIIAGTACIAGQFYFALIRYNLNGTLDSSFGANGIVTTKLNSSSNSVARSISIQSNGKLLAAGSTINAGYCDFAVVRYNYNGTLDNSFGTNGIVTTQIGPSFFSEIESVVIQKDGKIIAGGYSIAGANTFFTLACYKGDEVTYAEDENPVIFPSSFNLAQNYPNPFNPTTTLSFVIGNRSFVLLKVYDVLGREIATLLKEEKMPGKYEIKFNANGLPSGIYFYRLQAVPVGRQAGEFIETKKMILLR